MDHAGTTPLAPEVLRSMTPYFTELFRLADAAGLLRDPERAVARMRSLCTLYGIEN